MIFLFPRWDMLIPWRVIGIFNEFFIPKKTGGNLPGPRLHGATWPWIPPTVGWGFGGGEGEGLRKLYCDMLCYNDTKKLLYFISMISKKWFLKANSSGFLPYLQFQIEGPRMERIEWIRLLQVTLVAPSVAKKKIQQIRRKIRTIHSRMQFFVARRLLEPFVAGESSSAKDPEETTPAGGSIFVMFVK